LQEAIWEGRAVQKFEPPGALNLLLAVVVACLWFCALFLVHSFSGALLAGVLLASSFVILPLYSLMHECEHSVFHSNRIINEVCGVLLSALFPGSFAFLRGCHLGHHKRNRSESERFEIIEEGQSAWKKRAFFYFVYLGGFWLSVPAAMLLLLIYPQLLAGRMLQSSVPVRAMLNGLPERMFLRIRLECAGVIAFHASLIFLFNFDWRYALFLAASGINWSAQQYIAHAHSPLDVLNGAHNLRASALYEKWLLHFNWHLAHHQNPAVSWLYLPGLNDDTRERPPYARSFFRFWRGPVRPDARRYGAHANIMSHSRAKLAK
jgi:fatty acid desaturase